MGNFDVTYNVLQVHLADAVALSTLQPTGQKEPPTTLPSNNYLTLALQPPNYPWTKEVIFVKMNLGGWDLEDGQCTKQAGQKNMVLW